jgi:cob(I)alamin adenosyltransferase
MGAWAPERPFLPVAPWPVRSIAEPMSMSGLIGKGYIHLYTGDGKGKTTAALGLALRAVGNGLRVLIIQFLKSGADPSGEEVAAGKLAPQLEIRRRGAPGFVQPDRITEEDRRRAQSALAEASKEMAARQWDLIVLDEINVAVAFGLVPLEDVQSFLDGKPAGLEVVLTGRRAPQELIDAADLVTEMREVKHYYNDGVEARRGIEK